MWVAYGAMDGAMDGGGLMDGVKAVGKTLDPVMAKQGARGAWEGVKFATVLGRAALGTKWKVPGLSEEGGVERAMDKVDAMAKFAQDGADRTAAVKSTVAYKAAAWTADLLQGWSKGMQANNAVENAIGVALLACMYGYGWLSGMDDSMSACADPEMCGPFTIVYTLAINLTTVWIIVVIMVLVLIAIDKVLVATLFKSNNLESLPDLVDASVTIGVRIAFAWIFNTRILVALALAMVITVVFGMVYIYWMELREASVEDRRLAVRNLYVFNLGIVVMMITAQMWLDEWWKAKG